MSVIPEVNGFRCIAMDTYGAARSKSSGEKLTLEALAEDAVGLMDNLSMEKAVIVGHSMGGTMVFTIAAAYPDRVTGVVAIGPVNPKLEFSFHLSLLQTLLSNPFLDTDQ